MLANVDQMLACPAGLEHDMKMNLPLQLTRSTLAGRNSAENLSNPAGGPWVLYRPLRSSMCERLQPAQ